jgi:hypothetical protein
LLEDKEEKLCIQVLNTLRQMMNFDVHNGVKVFQLIFKVNELHKLTYYFPQKQGDTLRKNLLGALFCQTGLS